MFSFFVFVFVYICRYFYVYIYAKIVSLLTYACNLVVYWHLTFFHTCSTRPQPIPPAVRSTHSLDTIQIHSNHPLLMSAAIWKQQLKTARWCHRHHSHRCQSRSAVSVDNALSPTLCSRLLRVSESLSILFRKSVNLSDYQCVHN